MAVWMAAVHGSGRGRDVVVERFGYTVEHQSDAHAGGEHHRDPGNGTEFGLLAVLAQRDVAELAEGQPQDKDDEQGSQDHKEPAGVLHDPVQGRGGGSREAVTAHEAPDHKGDGDDAGDPERYLVERERVVPAQRDGLLSPGTAKLFQDLLVLFDVRQWCRLSVPGIEDSGVCVFFFEDTDDFFGIAQTFGLLVRVSVCHAVVGRQLLGCMGF